MGNPDSDYLSKQTAIKTKAAPRHRSEIPWFVGGLVLMVVSIFTVPRGVIRVVLTIMHPEFHDLPYEMGAALVGLIPLVAAVIVIVRGSLITKANRKIAKQPTL